MRHRFPGIVVATGILGVGLVGIVENGSRRAPAIRNGVQAHAPLNTSPSPEPVVVLAPERKNQGSHEPVRHQPVAPSPIEIIPSEQDETSWENLERLARAPGDILVRAAALQRLFEMSPIGAISVLTETAQSSAPRELRLLSIELLGQIRNHQAVEAVVSFQPELTDVEAILCKAHSLVAFRTIAPQIVFTQFENILKTPGLPTEALFEVQALRQWASDPNFPALAFE